MKPMVIFIDDSETALASTKAVTANMEIDVKQYLSAIDALQDLKDGTVVPDLVVTDLNMPIMDGIEMIKEIRKDNKDIPILVFSAYNEKNIVDDTKECNIQGYLFKPMEFKQFIDELSKVV